MILRGPSLPLRKETGEGKKNYEDFLHVLLRHLVCISLLPCPLLSGPFLPKLSADGIGIWDIFVITLLTVYVVRIHLWGAGGFPPSQVFFYCFFFLNPPFLPLACPPRELEEVVILMEGDYFDGIPARVIH